MGFLETFKKTKALQSEADTAAPKKGDWAPDFELEELDGKSRCRISDYRSKKPVVLVFGSYTWPPFTDGTVRLRDLYHEYQDQIQFLMVYIREAHPIDGWWLGKGPMNWMLKLKGTKAAFDVYDPKSSQERRLVAQRCADTLAYGIPTLLDGIDNAVNQAYAAWPTRLYLVGLDGRIEYAAGLGPWGFKPAELEQEIRRYLAVLVGS